jgi:DHA3 family macrolide efflux protein-like MFS transporter
MTATIAIHSHSHEVGLRILAPLRNGPVARVWSALAFSSLGDQLYAVALGWVAIGVLGPAAGYLGAARAAIVLLAATVGGGIADRWDRRRTMVGADLARGAVLLALVAVWAAASHPPAVMLLLAVMVLAVGEAFFQPALQTLLPTLINEPRLLVAANGLLDATDRLARLLGPGLIAVLGAAVAPMHFFMLDGLSFLVSALAVASLRVVGAPPRAVAPATWRRAASTGFRAMRRERLLGYLLHISGVLNGAWYAVFFLAVPLVITGLHEGADGLGLYGLVISCYGVSNLAANLFVGSRDMPAHPRLHIFCGITLTGGGIALMGIACIAPLSPAWRLAGFIAASALSGFGGPLKDIPFATLRQMLIPRDEIAAAMRAYLIMVYSGMLIAMLLAPAACTLLGAPVVILLCGALYLVTAATGWVYTR